MMKNSKSILLLFFSLLILLGCNKKSSDGVSPALVGKWKNAGTKGSFTISFMGQSGTESLDEAASSEILEFKSDGTVSGSDSGFGKYKTSGSQITFTVNDSGKVYDATFNYTVSGSTLTLSLDKGLFIQLIDNVSKAGVSGDLADLVAFKDAISAVDVTQTYQKQ